MTEWKLVPAKPTDAMMTAMESASDDWPRTTWQYAWQVALAAAPTPPVVLPPLTDDLIMSACYSFRHDFGLLSRDEQTALMDTAREWARCFGIKEKNDD